MTSSQINAAMVFSTFFVWGPLIALSWFESLPEKGESPLSTLRQELGCATLRIKWPGFTGGQKHFFFAVSFFCATLGVASVWIGVGLRFLQDGMSPFVDAMPQPLGSWVTLWSVQIAAIVIFYAWLEFWPKR